MQRKGQAGRAGPRCVWPMCHVCGRRPTPLCGGRAGSPGLPAPPPALQETRPSQVRPCLLPLLGAFVNSGLSITKAPKRRKLNNGGGAFPPTLPPQKVINVMRAEDEARAVRGPRPLLCACPRSLPRPPTLQRTAPHRGHGNSPTILSRWRLFPTPALFPGSSLSSGPHGRGPGRAGRLPPLGCAWPSAWCEGDPKGLTVSRCEDAHVRVMCAHA